jgi:hypothetical protein
MINDQIDKTLNSLDGLQRVPASPFLYQKIRLRLSIQLEAQRVNPKLAWRLAAACLLLLMVNVVSLIRLHNMERAGAETAVQLLYGNYISTGNVHSY